jgi:Tol biopolymer transport system component
VDAVMARVIARLALLLLSSVILLIVASTSVGRARYDAVLAYIEWDEFVGHVRWFDLGTGVAQRFYPLDEHETALELAWSPNGQWLAVVATGAAGLDTYIVIVDRLGNEISRIANAYATFQDPSWFPDNETLLFTVYGNSARVYAANIYTPDDWRLVLGERDEDSYYNVQVSPDGTQILFSLIDEGIYVVNSDDTHLRKLVVVGYNPSWSPDSSAILYTQYPTNLMPVLYVVDVRSFLRHRLVTHGGYGDDAAWSSDAAQLAYVLEAGQNAYSQIYAMNADGSSVRQVTFNSRDHENPQWQP